ncbi:MAG: LPS-assembly protein, partial [Brevundimonas sp.]
MQGDRRFDAFKARLLAGAALVACAPLATPAWAQTTPLAAAAPSDGLPPEAVYVDADNARREGDTIIVSGTPENRAYVRTRGHVLRGENLSYDLNAGSATAEGRVEAIAPDGTVVYASRLELDENLETGVAVDFATRLANGASLMAATAVRRSENVSELNYARFTPCPICDDGGPKTPTISIQAEKVTQDEQLRAILYRNAVFYIGPVPVFYTPFFAHPDPSVERASGFLVPIVNYDEGRGVSVEVPYLHVVSPSEDWLISPQINTRVAPLLNLQWRRRFANGIVVARGGYTYEREFGDFDRDGDGDFESNVKFGDREHR